MSIPVHNTYASFYGILGSSDKTYRVIPDCLQSFESKNGDNIYDFPDNTMNSPVHVVRNVVFDRQTASGVFIESSQYDSKCPPLITYITKWLYYLCYECSSSGYYYIYSCYKWY